MTENAMARVAADEVHLLAEGPVWDAARNRLLWVDIRRGLVLSGELQRDGSIRTTGRQHFDQTIGAVAVSAGGDLLIAGAEALLVQTADGSTHAGPRIIPAESGRRLNDGKVDPTGRFLIGSLSLVGPSETETLSMVDPLGSTRVLDDDLTLSNGLGWSADGRTLYSIDTLQQTIYARSYDPVRGTAGSREVFLTVPSGYPDGMCLDAEDHLWIAMWGLGQVHRYSPDGQLVTVVDVPAPHTSSVAFAGPLLDTLVITTATQDLTPAQLLEYPDSGKLFTLVPGVLGAPVPQWGGFASLPIPEHT